MISPTPGDWTPFGVGFDYRTPFSVMSTQILSAGEKSLWMTEALVRDGGFRSTSLLQSKEDCHLQTYTEIESRGNHMAKTPQHHEESASRKIHIKAESPRREESRSRWKGGHPSG